MRVQTSRYAFLRPCLGDEQHAVQKLVCKSVLERDELVGLASNEGIFLLLRSHFNRLNVGSAVHPRNCPRTFHSRRSEPRPKQLRPSDEVRFAARLLNDVGIEPVPPRASRTSPRHLPNRGTRYLRDIDLLVAPQQLLTAVETVRRRGFVPDENDQLV